MPGTFRPGMLMNDQSWMWHLPILPDTRNVTSSPASADGLSPPGSPVGLTTASCGPAPRRASRSRSQDSSAAPMTIGTCGPTCFASPVPDGPLSSWENRLRQRLARIGSTESLLTWKASATPAGRSLSRLVPSMRPTDVTACGLWPTPTASLADKAIRTPEGARTEVERGKSPDLNAQVMALWPTPTSLAPAKNGNNEAGNSAGLVAIRAHALAAAEASLTAAETQWRASHAGSAGTTAPASCPAPSLAFYPTPRASANENRTTKIPPSQLDGRHGLYLSSVAIGMEPDGSSATTEKPGALAPEFVAWLMGFPPEWLDCAPDKKAQPRFKGMVDAYETPWKSK